MLNQVILIGRVKELPVVKERPGGALIYSLLLNVDRPFKNSDGTLSIDVFKVFLWKGIADQYMNVLNVGDCIALKGRIQSNVYEADSNKVFYNAEIYAEKLSIIPERK